MISSHPTRYFQAWQASGVCSRTVVHKHVMVASGWRPGSVFVVLVFSTCCVQQDASADHPAMLGTVPIHPSSYVTSTAADVLLSD